MTLAILLSSHLFYVQNGRITDQSFEDLSVLEQLSNDVIYTQSFKDLCPNFTWVMKDFDVGFLHVTAETYLEQSLEEENRISDEAASKNKIKRNLKSLFPRMDCLQLAKGDQAAVAKICKEHF